MSTYHPLREQYYKIMDLTSDQLDLFLPTMTREEIISWLQWNDPNGVYIDKQSLNEFDNILSKEEGIEIMKRQILEC